MLYLILTESIILYIIEQDVSLAYFVQIIRIAVFLTYLYHLHFCM